MAKQTILIVDDSQIIRSQIKNMLPQDKFQLLEAKDGVEGLSLINQENPQLVLLDFFMPYMNGWEVVQKVKGDPHLQTIPIVMMSGRRRDVLETVPDLFDYFEFVEKPFKPNVLLKAIKLAFEKAKGRMKARPVDVSQRKTLLLESQAEELKVLKTEVRSLQTQNRQLEMDVSSLKQQVEDLVSLLRSKLIF